MDAAPAPYMIRIKGYLGATVLCAFPALAPQHHGAHTAPTGLLDRSALFGVLAEIEAPGPDLLEIRKLTSTANHPRPHVGVEAFWTSRSLAVSSAEVASSSIRMRGRTGP